MTLPVYLSPDLANIRESREAIRYQAIVGSADLYIKALSDELIELNSAVGRTDQQIANSIAGALTALQTDELRENLQALNALKERETSPQIEQAIKSYSTIAEQLLELCVGRIAQLYSEVDASIFEVQSVTISNNRFRLSELKDASAKVQEQLTAEQVPLDELNKDLALLNDAIKEFEKLTVIDRFKPLLEQLKSLIGNKPKTPEIAAMEAGFLVATKFLEEANELIKYDGLTKARDTINIRRGQREERVSSLAKQLRDNADKTRQLNDTQKVLPHRQTYVSETTRLTDSLNAFLDVVPAPEADLQIRGEFVVLNSQALRSYLGKLQEGWLRG
jgi:predicted transcriptional regulator